MHCHVIGSGLSLDAFEKRQLQSIGGDKQRNSNQQGKNWQRIYKQQSTGGNNQPAATRAETATVGYKNGGGKKTTNVAKMVATIIVIVTKNQQSADGDKNR